MAKRKPEPEPPAKRRRWPWLLLLFGAAVWFAPSIAMRTPLKRTMLDYANPGINADIDIGATSLGWMSPVVLRGVRVIDPEGNVVAEAESVTTDRTLWNLATDSTNLGTFTVNNVSARLEADSTTSNLEQIIAPLFEGPSSTTIYQYRVNVQNGTILMTNSDTGRTSQLTDVGGYVQSTDLGNAYPEISLQMTGHASESTQSGGTLQTDLTWTPPTDAHPIRGNARVRGADVSMLTFGPALNRFANNVYADGRLKCDFAVDWSDDFTLPAFRFRGGLAVDNARVVAADYMGSDQLNLNSVQFAGNVDVTGSTWAFDQIHARTDFADIRGGGAVTIADGNLIPSEQFPLTANGRIDLADLANRIPGTLRLQEGTRLTEGVANISLATQHSDSNWFVTGDVQTNAIRGQRDGQEIAWNDPLKMQVRIRNGTNGFVVDRVSADSEFLQLAGTGTLDNAQLQGRCDLDKLKQRLDQFVDTSTLQLRGSVDCRAGFSRDAGGVFGANALVEAKNFAMRMSPETGIWSEPQLTAKVRATGRMEGTSLREIQSFDVNLSSGSDALTAKLRQPVTTADTSALVLPLDAELKGNIETWLPRLRPVVELPLQGSTGTIGLTSSVDVSKNLILVQTANLTGSNVNLPISEDVVIAEPTLTASLAGRIDLNKMVATFPEFKMQTTSFAAVGSETAIRFDDQFQAASKCTVVADLQRLSLWRQGAADGEPITGRARGDLVIRTNGNTITAQMDASLRDSSLLSALQPRPLQVAQTPNGQNQPIANPASVSCVLAYDLSTDTLRLQKTRLDSDAATMQLDGTIAQLTTSRLTDLSGQVAYDFEHLNSLLRTTFGDHIRLKGKGSHPFVIQGPLTGEVNRLAGSGKISWDAAQAYGLVCGPGSIDAQIENGIVQIKPIAFSLNGGTAKLLPTVDLRNSPVLQLARGTEIRNVELTEEVTAEWLKFVAPLLADSALVQGKFSTAVQGATIPLSDPTNGDIPGVLQIHTAQAEAGPLVQQVMTIVNQVRQIAGRKARNTDRLRTTVPEQTISFRMVQQRVHHKDFELDIDGVNVQTSGSVGLDQSLQMVARLTLPEKWLGSGTLAEALRSRPLRIPISGTLKRPRLDSSVLRTLGAQAAGGAANDLIRKNLDRGLNKLFDKIKE